MFTRGFRAVVVLAVMRMPRFVLVRSPSNFRDCVKIVRLSLEVGGSAGDDAHGHEHVDTGYE
jgi:hypothetical protein|tara:strand:- start:5660 stop:5845 length:186 start_codon:yes stop_codon:yes gene_type:complete